MTGDDRAGLERRWLKLTREILPELAAARRFPVRHEHCFQRILLAAACGGRWADHVAGRPAYRRIDTERLAAAVALAERVTAGEADLDRLNIQSLRWRGEPLRPAPSPAHPAPPAAPPRRDRRR